jgi:hypothetical protein
MDGVALFGRLDDELFGMVVRLAYGVERFSGICKLLGAASKPMRAWVVTILAGRRMSCGLVEDTIAHPHSVLAHDANWWLPFGQLYVGHAEWIVREELPLARLRSSAGSVATGGMAVQPPVVVPDWSLRTVGSFNIWMAGTDDVPRSLRMVELAVPGVKDLHIRMDAPPESFVDIRLPDTVESASISIQVKQGDFVRSIDISGNRLTSFMVSAQFELDLTRIRMPNLRALLLASKPRSFAGIQALTSLHTLAIRRVSLRASKSLAHVASLCTLHTLSIFVEYHEPFCVFADRVLPSLTRLMSLDVRTPGGARDGLLGRSAGAVLTNLTRLCLLRIQGCDSEWPGAPIRCALPSTRLRVIELGGMQPYGFFSNRGPWWQPGTGLSSVTDLLLDATDPDCELQYIGVGSLPALRVLTLRNLPMMSLGVVGCTPHLTRLTVEHCRAVADLQCVADLTGLVELRVRACNRGASFPSIETLSRLDFLGVDMVHVHRCLGARRTPQSNVLRAPRITRVHLYIDDDMPDAIHPALRATLDRIVTANTLLRELTLVYHDGVWSCPMNSN